MEQLDNKKVKFGNVFKFSGAIIGFLIGSGFATGQEVLQYFTSEGFAGIGGIIIAFIVYALMIAALMKTGFVTKLSHSKDVFQYYGGKWIGLIYEYFSALLLFLVFTVMVSGAGAIFQQNFGINETVGRIIMIALVVVSILVGFSKILNILGPLGPIIIVGCVIVAIAAICHNPSGIGEAPAFIEGAGMLKASSAWWLSGILYGIFNVFPLASFGTALGAEATSKKEAVVAGFVGAGAFSLGVLLLYFGQMANIESVYDSAIPTLALAQNLVPVLAMVFGVILLLGIYTTVTPTFWAVVEKFSEEGTKRRLIMTLVLAVAAFVVSFLPFGVLMNVVYPMAGYLAVFIIVCMIVKHVRIATGKDDGQPKKVEGSAK